MRGTRYFEDGFLKGLSKIGDIRLKKKLWEKLKKGEFKDKSKDTAKWNLWGEFV